MKLTRRRLMILSAVGATGAAQALDADGESGNLFGGTLALSQAYQVAGNLWVGPDSAKSQVDADSGRIYMASDTDVDYYGDGGTWQVRSIGSPTNKVPDGNFESLAAEDAVIENEVNLDAEGSAISIDRTGKNFGQVVEEQIDPNGDTFYQKISDGHTWNGGAYTFVRPQDVPSRPDIGGLSYAIGVKTDLSGQKRTVLIKRGAAQDADAPLIELLDANDNVVGRWRANGRIEGTSDVRATMTSGSVADTTADSWEPVPLNNTEVNVGSAFDTGTHRFTPAKTKTYRVSFSVGFSVNANDVVGSRLRDVTGGNNVLSSPYYEDLSGGVAARAPAETDLVTLTAGTEYELQCINKDSPLSLRTFPQETYLNVKG